MSNRIKAQRAINNFKVRSRGLLRNVDLMDKLWRCVLKPRILYGQEIIVYDKEWIRWLESAQHQVGCKILGTRTLTNRTGVRLELGWKSIEGEIMAAKIRYLGKIQSMEEHRLPKIILREMLGSTNPVGWTKEINKIKDDLQVPENFNELKKVVY